MWFSSFDHTVVCLSLDFTDYHGDVSAGADSLTAQLLHSRLSLKSLCRDLRAVLFLDVVDTLSPWF